MSTTPTRGAGTIDATTVSWSARPWVARALRAAIVVTPAIVSLVATWVLSPMLYRPAGTVGVGVYVVQLGVIGFTLAVATERATRRFVPLANLLGMSLTFPDNAPSRFGVALRSGTVRQLEKEVAYLREHGLSDDSSEAAAQLLVLVNVLGKHERLTRGHTERVRAYSDLIGEEMGLSPRDRELLHWAGLIHDIGKLAVPAPILSKVERLEDAEWQTIKLHPEVGAALVQPLESWLGDWRLAASEHHERWDGAGYPLGLAGTEISLAGRIVAVADAYDVMTSTRSYKKASSADEARRELVRCAGSQFDPEVVRAFLAVSVGRLHPVAGRFAWLANLGTLLQGAPAALQTAAVGAAGAATVTAAVATGAVVVPDDPEPAAAAEAPALVDGVGRAVTTTTPAPQGGFVFPSIPDVGAGGSIFVFPSIPDQGTSTTTTVDGAATTTSSSSTTTSSPGSSSTTSSSSTTTSTPGSSSTTSSTTSSSTSTSTTSTSTTVPGEGSDCGRAQSGDTQLDGAELFNCDLAGYDLEDADLDNADLTGANLAGADLADADIRSADLTGANVANADLDDAVLDNSILVDASFVGSDLTKAQLHDVDARGADFTGATLTDAHLERTNATGAIFVNAGLDKANLDRTVVSSANLSGASGVPRNHARAIWGNTTCPNGAVQSTDCYG